MRPVFVHDPTRDRTRVVHLDDRGRAVLVDVETDLESDLEAGGSRPVP